MKTFYMSRAKKKANLRFLTSYPSSHRSVHFVFFGIIVKLSVNFLSHDHSLPFLGIGISFNWHVGINSWVKTACRFNFWISCNFSLCLVNDDPKFIKRKYKSGSIFISQFIWNSNNRKWWWFKFWVTMP